MRMLGTSILVLASAVMCEAATTFPASTNATQTFFGANTFAQPITSSSLTADTILKSGGFKAITSIPNGTGALTNDNLGDFGWYSGFASISQLNSASNTLYNLITTSTNSQNLSVTNITTATLTVTNSLTNLSLTANTVLKANGSKVVTSIPNGTGALTNDNAGNFGWFTYAALTDLNSASNSILSQFTNTINSTSNAILTQVTNSINTVSNNLVAQVSTNAIFTNAAVLVEQIDYLTNSCTMAPDFSKGYCWISTNAAFTFLSPLNKDSTATRVQTTVMVVTNSSGTAIAATAPANVHVVPGSTMYVTNATAFTWFLYPLIGTNVYANPLF